MHSKPSAIAPRTGSVWAMLVGISLLLSGVARLTFPMRLRAV